MSDTPIFDALNAEMDGAPKVWNSEWSNFAWKKPKRWETGKGKRETKTV